MNKDIVCLFVCMCVSGHMSPMASGWIVPNIGQSEGGFISMYVKHDVRMFSFFFFCQYISWVNNVNFLVCFTCLMMVRRRIQMRKMISVYKSQRENKAFTNGAL